MKTYRSLRLQRRWQPMLLVAIFLGVIAMGGARQSAPERADIEDLLLQLESESAVERERAWMELRRRHQTAVKRLHELASRPGGDRQDYGTREIAALLLGDFASRDYGVRWAIPQLVKDVELKGSARVFKETSVPGYPCAIALGRAGHGALPEILRYLQQTSSEEVSDLAIDLYGEIVTSAYWPEDIEAAIAWVELRQRKAAKLKMPLDTNFRRLLSRLEKYRPK